MNRREIVEVIRERRSFLCVGLDSDRRKLPAGLAEAEDGMFEFNRKVIDATAPYCVAYKPNVAFYESEGPEGWLALEKTVKYLKAEYPRHLVIADAKRGDIGNSSALYARCFFERLGVDALTVAPYMGRDSVEPFLKYEGKWVVLLALTSNAGADDFEIVEDCRGERLFERVIRRSAEWVGEERMMYVVGATRAEMLADVRRVAPRSFLLVPGVGAQGGSLEDVCRYGMTEECGLIVNASRAIIFAGNGDDFAEVAGERACGYRDRMARLLEMRGL